MFRLFKLCKIIMYINSIVGVIYIGWSDCYVYGVLYVLYTWYLTLTRYNQKQTPNPFNLIKFWFRKRCNHINGHLTEQSAQQNILLFQISVHSLNIIIVLISIFRFSILYINYVFQIRCVGCCMLCLCCYFFSWLQKYILFGPNGSIISV